jgi:hypothetical protein
LPLSFLLCCCMSRNENDLKRAFAESLDDKIDAISVGIDALPQARAGLMELEAIRSHVSACDTRGIAATGLPRRTSIVWGGSRMRFEDRYPAIKLPELDVVGVN